jgi:Glycosyl transferase family 2
MSSKASSGSWCVHSTVHEPTQLLCAFIAHHLEMGASEVHLFLDQPTEQVVETLRKFDGVRLTLCDDSYWQQSSAGYRSDHQVQRQIVNANRAYAEAKQDWFLFCDADEFVFCPSGLATPLAAVDPSVGFVKIGVAERSYSTEHPQQTLFDSTFYRLPIDPAAVDLKEIYGENAKLMPRGTLGHARGKSAVRTGLSYDIRVHFPVDQSSQLKKRRQQKASVAALSLADAKLLHFDGLTPLHWMIKLLKRHLNNQTYLGYWIKLADGHQKKRFLQFEEMNAARDDPARLLELSRIQFTNADLRDRLREVGGLFEAAPQIEATAQRHFPEMKLDFSVETFNAQLREQNAELIANSVWPTLTA